MRVGVSTACFYPEDTKAALRHVADMGSEVTEVFLNTFRETDEEYVAELRDVAQSSGVRVSSVHPFTGPLEGLLFASAYETRAEDGIQLFRSFYRACRMLGADKLILHGDHASPNPFPIDKHAAIIRRLAAAGQEYGVALCYENVYYCRLGKPAAVRQIRPLLGEHAAFTLDLKQLRRADVSLDDMLDAMGNDVRQVHISDFDRKNDCIPPGEGSFDFTDLINKLKGLEYSGDLIIELYRDGFETAEQLERSLRYMQHLMGPKEVEKRSYPRVIPEAGG